MPETSNIPWTVEPASDIRAGFMVWNQKHDGHRDLIAHVNDIETARLIAAAPELLKAMQEAIAHTYTAERHSDDGHTYEASEYTAMARHTLQNAIARMEAQS